MGKPDHACTSTPGLRLRRWMEANGWTQQALADLLNVRQPSVSKWIAGKRRPNLNAIVRLERLAKIPARAWSSAA